MGCWWRSVIGGTLYLLLLLLLFWFFYTECIAFRANYLAAVAAHASEMDTDADAKGETVATTLDLSTPDAVCRQLFQMRARLTVAERERRRLQEERLMRHGEAGGPEGVRANIYHSSECCS